MRLDLDAKGTLGAVVFAGALIFGGSAAAAQEVDTYRETPPPEAIDSEGDAPQDDGAEGEAPQSDGEAPTDVLGDEAVAGDGEPTTDVLGDEAVAGDSAAADQPGEVAGLPVTGGDLVGLTVLGAGAIALGAAALHHRRRYA